MGWTMKRILSTALVLAAGLTLVACTQETKTDTTEPAAPADTNVTVNPPANVSVTPPDVNVTPPDVTVTPPADGTTTKETTTTTTNVPGVGSATTTTVEKK